MLLLPLAVTEWFKKTPVSNAMMGTKKEEMGVALIAFLNNVEMDTKTYWKNAMMEMMPLKMVATTYASLNAETGKEMVLRTAMMGTNKMEMGAHQRARLSAETGKLMGQKSVMMVILFLKTDAQMYANQNVGMQS